MLKDKKKLLLQIFIFHLKKIHLSTIKQGQILKNQEKELYQKRSKYGNMNIKKSQSQKSLKEENGASFF